MQKIAPSGLNFRTPKKELFAGKLFHAESLTYPDFSYVTPFQGFRSVSDPVPGALHRAGMFRPFREASRRDAEHPGCVF
ncbi:hypothetical protein DENIS_3548 [Desulfonema ishimotonii]|uniref:Uncharacterized protein n=1 Tax=Desulfonema ishimotonii TaxID=45657 RepID=A0A401G061_9BACT|nr:hypothetical protein DENIS_3548 [Desulfonema ishimotonii]